jgi:polysaccharide pyruvyl transferase WcaK-like protein
MGSMSWPRTAPRILCTGFWHDDNGGDAAIAEATLRLVQEQWPGARIDVMSLMRSSDADLRHSARHLLRSVPGVRLLPGVLPDEMTAGGGMLPGRLARAAGGARWLGRLAGPAVRVATGRPPSLPVVAGADLVVGLGGCDVYDDGGVLAPFSLGRLLTVLYPTWVAGRAGVPVALFGHTFGPFPRRSGRAMARHMLDGVDWARTRERESVAVATRIGLHEVADGPDVAFALPVRTTERTHAIAARFAGRTVGLVVRQHPHRGRDGDDAVLHELVALGRALLAAGRADHLAVVVQARGPTAVEDDRALSARLAGLLPAGHVTLVDEDLAPGELAAVYGALDFVVTVRLHAAILAMTAGTPAFAISYFSTKTGGIMGSVGGHDAWCTHESFRATTVLGRIGALTSPERRDALRRHVARHAAALRAEVARWDLDAPRVAAPAVAEVPA